MTKTELLHEIQKAIEYQLNAAEEYLREGNTHEYSAWLQRAQVLGWAKARLERLDSLE